MPIVITGGTGFIGSRLAEICLRAGHEVTALGRANTPAEASNIERLERAGAKVLNASVTDSEALNRAFAGMDVVFHLAAAQHEMNVPDAHFRQVNVEGTRKVLDAALAQRVRRVLHGSTIGVYGSADGVIDEESACRPDNIYGVTKLEGERLALSYADRIEIVVARIPEVYGPGDRRLLKLFRAVERGKFVNIGPGRNLHHPMYVDDLVAAFLALAAHPEAPGKVFLLAGRDAVSTNDMVGAVAAAVGASAPKVRLPLAPLLGVATLMEVTLRPLGIQPPLHRRRMDFFRKSFSLRPTRAAQLGIAPPTTFRDGARETAAWYRAMGLLGGRDGANLSPGSGAMSSPVTSTESSVPIDTAVDDALTAQMEPFDSFWEAPTNIEKGYRSFAAFYRHNYLRWIPQDRSARIVVISCGPGYFVNLLRQEGYTNVVGIDSFADKVAYATRRGLDCRVARAFGFLTASARPWDAIIAEQELNHLTKDEILRFLTLCREKLTEGGTVIVHAINGAHPIVGSESRWGNFDHYNAWTHYSLHQVLEHTGYQDIQVFPLNLYVFWTNPFNYVALAWDTVLRWFFLFCFKMVGKSNKLFSKKIGAVGRKPASSTAS